MLLKPISPSTYNGPISNYPQHEQSHLELSPQRLRPTVSTTTSTTTTTSTLAFASVILSCSDRFTRRQKRALFRIMTTTTTAVRMSVSKRVVRWPNIFNDRREWGGEMAQNAANRLSAKMANTAHTYSTSECTCMHELYIR